MVSPATVWLARPGEERAERGTLSLAEGVLSFAADGGGRTVIPLPGVRRVRRHRGTPVLEVRYEAGGKPREALFYFVEPPPLPASAREVRERGPWAVLPGDRGLRRATGLLRLRSGNRAMRPVVEAWERAIGEATGA